MESLTKLQSEKQQILYVLYFEVVGNIFPERHLKNPVLKEYGSNGVYKGKSREDVWGQRDSEVPYFSPNREKSLVDVVSLLT